MWPPHSHVIIASDSEDWSLSWDAVAAQTICKRLGIPSQIHPQFRGLRNQCLFGMSQFMLLKPQWLSSPNRFAFPYYHGLPGTGDKHFDTIYHNLEQHHDRVARVQVTHQQLRSLVLSTGIDPAKVFTIRIGIDCSHFPLKTDEHVRASRSRHTIPTDAFVVASLHKDGVGWEDGFEPKLIKGPDVFLHTIELLKKDIPNLHVLLSGPARGFVRRGLDRIGVPYRHVYLDNYLEMSALYHAADVYVVASRQEGGPKAVLEAMASGTPVVSTRVGQAQELIETGVNGFLAPVEDATTLAEHVRELYRRRGSLGPLTAAGRRTAEANDYAAQTDLWRAFYQGYYVS